MSFRKELKFKVTRFELATLKGELLRKGMISLHPKRKIISQYFDSADISMFRDSEEGSVPRKKIRLRWYDRRDAVTLETKISSIEGRYKFCKKVTPAFAKKLNKNGLIDNVYGSIFPSLQVIYEREYFMYGGIRVTFDTNISYNKIKNLSQGFQKDPSCVVELKVPMSITDDYISSIFPYSNQRFSKYSRGVLMFRKDL